MRFVVNLGAISRHCFAIGLVAGMAACSSSPGPQAGAAQAASMIYVSSARTPTDVAACLRSRLPSVRASRSAGVTELDVGPGSRADHWSITLTPSSRGGTVIDVRQPPSGGDPDETAMRFHIARCAT
jgi:hypothetical protein